MSNIKMIKNLGFILAIMLIIWGIYQVITAKLITNEIIVTAIILITAQLRKECIEFRIERSDASVVFSTGRGGLRRHRHRPGGDVAPHGVRGQCVRGRCARSRCDRGRCAGAGCAASARGAERLGCAGWCGRMGHGGRDGRGGRDGHGGGDG